MGQKLETVKCFIQLDRVIGISSNPIVIEGLKDLRSSLEKLAGFGISTTTPSNLYNKPYSKLNKRDLNEYTQIKRLINRSRNESLGGQNGK